MDSEAAGLKAHRPASPTGRFMCPVFYFILHETFASYE
jgi:hypothetical protein